MRDMLEMAKELEKQIVDWRRYLHSIPEESFREEKTSTFLAERLECFGYQVTTGVARTGVVGTLGSGPTICLRTEIDGYPVQEALAFPHASKHPGWMHACGHDANMACVLGAAKLLSDSSVPGRIKVFMQPASESVSKEDKMSGSNKAIREGVLDDLAGLLSLHVDTTINSGNIGLLINRKADQIYRFSIEIEPEENRPDNWNAVSTGARIVTEIFNRVRENETYESLIEIDYVRSKTDTSTEYAVIKGRFESLGRETFRFFDTALKSVCRPGACNAALSLKYDDPESHSGADLVGPVEEILRANLGTDIVKTVNRKAWSDDFFPFSSRVPAALIFLGVGAHGKPSIMHTGTFDIDENQLYMGSFILARVSSRLLSRIKTTP